MANTQAMCTSFKSEILQAYHNFGTTVARGVTTADVFKGAVYLAVGTLGAGTTVYAATNEIANSGTYAAGGATITNATPPAVTGTTAYWTPSAQLQWTSVTFAAADALLVYNSTQGNRAVSVHNFGSQSVTTGTFTLTMPVNGAGTALINIA
jgi:hypothetical protein